MLPPIEAFLVAALLLTWEGGREGGRRGRGKEGEGGGRGRGEREEGKGRVRRGEREGEREGREGVLQFTDHSVI